MIVTLASLRTRWVTLTGSFVALTLGVALLATMGLALASTLDAPRQRPERLATAPVVVRGPDELRVGAKHRPLANYRGVPAGVAARLAAAVPTVTDRSFAVGGGFTGHPWPVARYGGYRLTAGRAPAAAGEVVISGDPSLTGTRVRGRVVTGTVAPAPYERAMFFTGAEAARLSPRIDNLVVDADPATVRALAGPAPVIQVLTGDDRRRADPDPDRDAEALMTVNALLGTAGGITTFVSVFVVASTFAFAVAQRRRELGLLRTAGATPGQVRRMVLAEAAVVGVLASAAGCVLGARGAPLLAGLLVDERLAPPWFVIGAHRWPFHVAFWTGLVVALAGAVTAAVRAGRVGPLEALREAAVDSGTMPPGRRIAGALVLATGLGLLIWRLVVEPGEALHRKTYTTQPMLLITAVALLAPVLVRPLVRAVRLPGVTGLLARENAAAGIRRTAAVAAPVLITVALAGSLLGATATITTAKATELGERTRADVIVEHPDAATVARARAVPGARVMTSAQTAVYVLEEGVALVGFPASAVDAETLASVRRLPVVAGSLADLDDTSIVVTDEWTQHTVGSRVDLWLGDGTPRTLRIAAVLAAGTGGDGAYLTPANAPGAAPDRLEMTVPEPSLGAGLGMTREQWLAEQAPRTGRQTRVGLLVVLGIALLYTAIALANTLVMATSGRVPEFTALRLAGATRGQVLRLVTVEALLVVAVGVVLGAAVTMLNLAGIWAALGRLSVWSPVIVPWQPPAGAAGACAVIAVTAALATAVRRAR
ncbi:ABC transporter permease [Actinoplanes auranticolor]|uniref:ABC transporter permease n=1 Tax=Actinoplanes auranticolor TaxID=47988 RepID=UPI001BB43F66|nr:ABC transporter permease [Actinoplanes auranticolor]